MSFNFRLLFLLLPLSFLTVAAQAQPGQRTGIRGQVIDRDAAVPLEFAAISVMQATDSALVTGGITDLDGRFQIETPPGRYLVKVEFISYRPTWVEGVVVNRENPVADLGEISLSTDAKTLQEVEVRAERSQMQMGLDKRVFNVGQDLASTSGSASEVLDNIPSITVDVEGNVSLRGSDNVRILIDGKPSGLVGVRGTDGLRSLPANMIERVEIITNPSARYEAEGMSGIINIILKKDRKQGLNGSFDLTAGVPENYGAAVNLNFRRQKFNFFANYGFNLRTRPGFNELYQEFYRGDTTRIVDQTGDRERGGWSNNFRLGADYFFNDRNILTSALLYRVSKGENQTELEYRDFLRTGSQPSVATGITRRKEDEEENEPTLEYDLNYKRTFERDGHEWNTSLQVRASTEEENARYEENFFTPQGLSTGAPLLEQRASNKEAETSIILQSDYIHPFGEKGKFEAGYRGSLRHIDNNYLVEEWADDEWTTLANLSNNFNYDEYIHAVYAIVGNKPGRLSYQFGLRMEYSEVLTELLQTNEVNDRTYTNLFPSAHLTYELPGDNNVQVSYTRRLRRPRFWDLNPFFTFADARNIFQGNPNLDPEFTNSFELGHIKYWNKANISSSLYYRHSTGVIQRIQQLQEQDGELITVRQPENLATEDAYGLEFIYSADPYKWWRLDGSFNFFRSIIDGSNVEQSLRRDTYTWFSRLNSRMTIRKAWDLQLRFNYRAPQETTQGKTKSISFVDLGVSRDLFQEKGTLTISVRDLFNSRKRRSETFGNDFFSEGTFQWRARQVTLTLNYRLNDNKRRNGRRGGNGDYDGGGDMEF